MPELNSHALASLLATHGYWVLLLIVAAESTGLPLPGETMLLLASVYAGTTHRLSVVLVILAATTGAILGDNLGFLIGRQGGYRLLHRYGSYLRLDERQLRLGHCLFQAHGGKVVFFGRFVPVLRIWAAFLAGTHRMVWHRFLVCNAAGGAVWASLMGLAGYTFGQVALRLGGVVGMGLAVLATLVMVMTMITLQRTEQRLKEKVACVPMEEWRASGRATPAPRARAGGLPVEGGQWDSSRLAAGQRRTPLSRRGARDCAGAGPARAAARR